MGVAVSAQISVYALRQASLRPAIDAVCAALAAHGLAPQVGPMSTVATGDSAELFAALRDGFERAAESGEVVLTVTVSNTCPVPRAPGG
jgi:uncharacterized protein YqgV (UPF0045/DUF77 family)